MFSKDSFFASLGNVGIDARVIAKNLRLTDPLVYSEHSLNLIFNKGCLYKSKDLSVFIVGKVWNEEILEQSFTVEDIPVLKGNFVALASDGKDLFVYASITGNIPAYILQEKNSVFITSQLIAFRGTDYFERKLIPIEQYKYQYTATIPQDFSLMQNCKRVIPGILYTFSLNDQSLTTQKRLKEISSNHKAIAKEKAKEKLLEILQKNISQNIDSGQPVAVPLSGGVDSGTIAGILSSQHLDLHTFSVGTEFGNEYEKAKISAEFCRAKHTELFMSEDDYAEGLLNSVFYNELCDPVYAEGFAAFYHVLKHASSTTHKFFTGYGADLVLGNMFKEKELSQIGETNASWCRRTSWTGELSPYVPGIFDSEMIYPYWSEEMLDFGLSLPAEFLQNTTHEKIILRELSEEKKLAHPDIAWNKKTAFTHGAALDKLFSKLLNIKNDTDYTSKSYFLYYLFEAFFVSDKTMEEIDVKELTSKIKHYDTAK